VKESPLGCRIRAVRAAKLLESKGTMVPFDTFQKIGPQWIINHDRPSIEKTLTHV